MIDNEHDEPADDEAAEAMSEAELLAIIDQEAR